MSRVCCLQQSMHCLDQLALWHSVSWSCWLRLNSISTVGVVCSAGTFGDQRWSLSLAAGQ
jgi:hypothetical protein